MQAPTLTTPRRQSLFVFVVALAVAAAVLVVIAIARHDDSSTTAVAPAQPAISQSAQDRVLDGSALLRATASAPAVTISAQSGLARVWDGSPILRGGTADPQSGSITKLRLASPTSSLAGTTESHPQAQFPVRPPEGFHRVP